MDNRKRLILAVVIILAVALFLMSTTNSKQNKTTTVETKSGKLQLIISPEIALPVSVFDDSNMLLFKVTSPDSSVSVPLGKGVFTLKSEGFEDYSFEAETYNDVLVKKEVALVLKSDGIQQSILSAISNTSPGSVSIDNGYWIKDIVYYENNLWATGTLVLDREANDGEKVIVNYKNSKWEVIYAGTGYDEVTLRSLGVPENIVLEVL